MENASAHPSPRFEMLSVMAKLITWYATKRNTGDYLPFMLCQAYQGSNFETRWIGTKVVRERFLTGTEPSGHSITERARFQRVARRSPIDVWLMRLSLEYSSAEIACTAVQRPKRITRITISLFG